MDFGLFGIGLDRIILIAVVALIVFGPDKLPTMARQAGKWVNDLRRLTQDARGEIQNLTKELDLSELNKVKSDLADLRKDLTGTGKDLLTPFQDIRKEVNLFDASGQSVATQYEQSTYQVERLPGEDGAIVVEETLTRETVIQDLVGAGEPVTATETVTATASATEGGVIVPAMPMSMSNGVASVAVPVMNGLGGQPATEPDTAWPMPLDNGLSLEELMSRPVPPPEWQREVLNLEGQMLSNRQEMHERIEALERTFHGPSGSAGTGSGPGCRSKSRWIKNHGSYRKRDQTQENNAASGQTYQAPKTAQNQRGPDDLLRASNRTTKPSDLERVLAVAIGTVVGWVFHRRYCAGLSRTCLHPSYCQDLKTTGL